MKLYLTADIEGIAGIAHWDEANSLKPDYAPFRARMTAHVAAACEGAVAAGATEIWVKDAHATARNIDAARLPSCARLIRGWSGHPLMMVQELDESFDAMAMVGYHARAGSGGNPLAHTMASSKIAELRINGEPASEFLVHAWAGSMLGVPTVFVSGDEALCEEVEGRSPAIHRVPVMFGVGDSTVSLHPDEAEQRIRDGMREALRGDFEACRLPLPDELILEIQYHKPHYAYGKTFYPGAYAVDERTVGFVADDYFELLRAVLFLI